MLKNKRIAIVLTAMLGGTVQLHASDIVWNWVSSFVSFFKTRELSTVSSMRAGVELVEKAQKGAEESFKKNDKNIEAKERSIEYRKIVADLKAKIEVQDITLRDMQYTEWAFLRRQIPEMKRYVPVQQPATQTMDVSRITPKPSIIDKQTAVPKAVETQKPEVSRVLQPGEVKSQPATQTPAQKMGAEYAASYAVQVYEQQHSGAPDGGMK